MFSQLKNSSLLQNIKYYSIFQLLFVMSVILLSSIGAFFHFLLDHEISIVESWLHNNQWEILITSKLFSLFLLNRWFKVRLYQFKSFRVHFKELLSWPGQKALVVSIFMLISYIALGDVQYVEKNNGYWYFQLASFLCLFSFFGIEFIVIGYLQDILSSNKGPKPIGLGILYSMIFIFAFLVTIPNYYKMIPHTLLCYTTLLYLSGEKFKNWSNVVCFLLIFVAPIGSLYGLDPVWGDDFSPFKFVEKPQLALLAVIWVISFSYYSFRDQALASVQKFLR